MSQNKHKARIAFSVTNCTCFDQRVKKMAGVVSDMGFEVTIIGRRLGNCCESDISPYKIKRFRMLFRKRFLFYMFMNIRLFLYLLFRPFDILVANDLDTLLPNYLISKLKRIPLVYDSHEYYTHVPELTNRHFVRNVWLTIERAIFPRLKNVITVSESIASTYFKLYNVKPLVVRNISPDASKITAFSRDEIGVPENNKLLILQGNGINIDKGAEELITAIAEIDGYFLLIVGSGDVWPDLKVLANKSGAGKKVMFVASVSWEKLIKYTKAADIGLCLEKDTNLNYRYSLPNKLFDYIASGIPVIAGYLPESGDLIRKLDCGFFINNITPEEICSALEILRDDTDLFNHLKKNAIIASEKLTWEKEAIKVRELYKSIITLQ